MSTRATNHFNKTRKGVVEKCQSAVEHDVTVLGSEGVKFRNKKL